MAKTTRSGALLTLLLILVFSHSPAVASPPQGYANLEPISFDAISSGRWTKSILALPMSSNHHSSAVLGVNDWWDFEWDFWPYISNPEAGPLALYNRVISTRIGGEAGTQLTRTIDLGRFRGPETRLGMILGIRKSSGGEVVAALRIEALADGRVVGEISAGHGASRPSFSFQPTIDLPCPFGKCA